MLLSGFGSDVVEVTVAVLAIGPVAVSDTVPLIKIVCDSPANNVPRSRVPSHGVNVVPPSIEYSVSIILSKILSVNTTFSAASGPSFVTTIV